ncbi:glucose dehydrogenase [FAD, quinone]-like [Vanessa cardui]|uniref:glucose dehydrogenase [FAD, quinone]-like n=1 Tax=Vanessa cardui TaxID=171605 RepID=UPI001F13CE5F|nr:glucose dehydrogenase [FAD, quinone]-like [Vanessa cardui]
MASDNFSLRPLVSGTRILFGLLPGLGSILMLRMVIHLYRPDIEDAEHRIKDVPIDELYNSYDFIIIGGGSAGSVVASRLSENPDWNILLLEAGPDENVLSEVPVLFPALQTSSIDWQFVTEPSSDYCLGMVDNRCKWPRGKVLGGSSTLNAMLYIRGNRKDYDNWAMLGNEGWAYKDVFKYFLKAEDMRIPEYQNDPYHSTGGPISVENFRYEQPITKKILEAGEQLGYSIVDVNGEFQTGFTKSHATLRDGLRCSTAKGYLRPAAKRDNLHISLHSLVEKILIDDHRNTYGVKFTKNGVSIVIRVNKEVILSAGTIQSPQILMLSGIGDSVELRSLGIDPIAHLPGVGKNLQDHVAMGGHSFLFDNPYTNGSDYCFNYHTVASIGSLIDFAINRNGPLYSMMEAEAMAFVNTKYQNPEEDYPDIQLFIAPTADNMDGGLFGKRANGLSDATYADLYEDILYQPSFSIVPLLLRPKSRGYIKLRNSDPHTAPLIYPNYYSDPEDMARMIEGARIAQMLVEQPALKELNARPNPNRNPGCKKHSLMSDEHLECQARHHSLTIYHPVGTCAMGPAKNTEAVVDAKLKVHGITNLRVIDGSIMPTIVSGNTNAPIIMIAEKASDIIKKKWADSRYIGIEYDSVPSLLYGDKDDTVKIKSRNAENSKSTPNMFNEISSLFPYLSQDILKQYEKAIINQSGRQNITDIAIQTTKVSRGGLEINNISNFLPNSYYSKELKEYKQAIGDRPRFTSNTVNNKVSAKQFRPYPYNRAEYCDAMKETILSQKSQKMDYFNNYTPMLSDLYKNYKQKMMYDNMKDDFDIRKENKFISNTKSVTSRPKKSNIWLYYNGLKYEIQL